MNLLIYNPHWSNPVESVLKRNASKTGVVSEEKHLPAGFETFSDVGRLTMGRPAFSSDVVMRAVVAVIVVARVVTFNIWADDGLLLDEASCD